MGDFKIGQEIICIQSHSKNLVVKDIFYTVKGLRQGWCACTGDLVDVGVSHPFSQASFFCYKCNSSRVIGGGIMWFPSALFAPLQTKSEEQDMMEALEEIMCEPITLD